MLERVAWFVGRENPTTDQHSCVELGYFGEMGQRIVNPDYLAAGYSSGQIDMDYSTVG